VLAGGPLDPVRTMDVVAQAAAGLDAAHRAGLVHRDIKPANLLVGPGGQIKITDFGIAHAAGSAPITRLGALVGTPAYLAPERAAGWRARPASDLYSLGVVAYQCLTAEVPFTGMPVEVALAHRDREFPPLPAAVPLPVAALIAELTAKDPAARPASAGDVARRAARVRDAMAGRGGGGTSAAPGGLDLAESHPTLVDRFAPFESPPRTATLPRAPASPHRRRGRGSRVSKLGRCDRRPDRLARRRRDPAVARPGRCPCGSRSEYPHRRGERHRAGRPAGEPGQPPASPAWPASASRAGSARESAAGHGRVRQSDRPGRGRQHRHGGGGCQAARAPAAPPRRTWARQRSVR